VLENQPAWRPHLRSKAALRQAPRRHFCDPSLAVAALGGSPERLLKDLGMDGVINNMDLGEVQSYVERATVEGQFQMERFTRLLQSVSDAEGLYEAEQMDGDTQAILEIMSAASRNRSDATIRDGLSQVDQLLHKEPAAS